MNADISADDKNILKLFYMSRLHSKHLWFQKANTLLLTRHVNHSFTLSLKIRLTGRNSGPGQKSGMSD